MIAPTATDDIRAFVAEVATYFDDLPPHDRDELLEDLEQHLRELAVEDDAALAAELTSAAAYADELRRSAGLPERPDVDGRPSRRRRVLDAVAERWQRVARQPQVAPVLEFLPQLRPAWWVLRAWVLVVTVAMVLGGGPWYRHAPIPGRSLLGLLALAGVVATSVKAGRDGADRTVLWRLADGVAGVAAVVLIVASAAVAAPQVQYVPVGHEEWQPPILRHPDGEPITNLYLYDLDGEPLTDVLVHDGLGRPVEIGDLPAAGFEDIETVHRRDRFGVPVRHLYPLEQYLLEPGPDGEPDRRPRPDPLATAAPSPTGAPTASPSPAPSPSP